MKNDDFLKVAKEAAFEAGKVISRYSDNKGKIGIKNNDTSDLVTTADLEAEKKIIQIIRENFPDHNIIAEESDKTENNSQFTWVIDPLDGTISFTNNIPSYAVGIGLLKNNSPILGVIYHVSQKRLYWAQINHGAYLNGKKINVTNRDKLSEAILNLDLGHKARRIAKFKSYVEPLKNKVGYIFSIGGFTASMGLMAAGSFDGVVAEGWVWDFVAGTVIIREAGGKVTDFEGKEPDWSKERLNIVASNGLIHDQIIDVLKSKH